MEGSAARARDLAAASLAARKRHRRAFAKARQPEFVEKLLEPLASHPLVRLGHLQHRQDVLLDGEPAEDRRFLRQVAEAEDRSPVHRQVGDVLAVQENSACVRLHQPHDGIKAGRLAGTVGTQQADNFAAVDGERNVVKHRPAVIGLCDGAHVEADIGSRGLLAGPDQDRCLVHGFSRRAWAR